MTPDPRGCGHSERCLFMTNSVGVARTPAVPDAVAQTFPTAAPVDKFAQMLAKADIADGHTLEKDKARLVGIPFLITGVTFREGHKRPDKTRTNYASVEIMVANADMLRREHARGRITDAQLAGVDPLETLVFNDGSTGILRVLVSYCHAKSYISVPDGPENGESGKSRYDMLRDTWELSDACTVTLDSDDNSSIAINLAESPLFCPRGLRASEYDHDDFGESTTYYIG